jgi:hypothetical protein
VVDIRARPAQDSFSAELVLARTGPTEALRQCLNGRLGHWLVAWSGFRLRQPAPTVAPTARPGRIVTYPILEFVSSRRHPTSTVRLSRTSASRCCHLTRTALTETGLAARARNRAVTQHRLHRRIRFVPFRCPCYTDPNKNPSIAARGLPRQVIRAPCWECRDSTANAPPVKGGVCFYTPVVLSVLRTCSKTTPHFYN